MIEARFVPIEKWPGTPRTSRRYAHFRKSYMAQLNALEYELRHLGARDIVIQAGFRSADIRNDGWPRSGARPMQPGVIVSFRNRKGEAFGFPCDTYTDFEDNLYAIALSLEALRAVDRHGVTQRAEQYQGWKRLEAPEHEAAKDQEWAYGFLAALNGIEPAALHGNRAALDIAYRAAAKKTHPDTGGNVDAFQTLQEARNLLGL